MNLHERKRGLRIGVGVLAALCAVLLGLTALSGCRVYVMGSTPRNPFLGEWHTDSTEDGVDFSAVYEFENNGRYSYSSRKLSSAMRRIKMTRGTYRYDDETLFFTPVPSDTAPSQLKYEFTPNDDLELEERISTSETIVRIYHRPHL